MTGWTGIVVAPQAAPPDEMVSRLPTYLHPIAGRPLIWHTVSAVARLDPPPARVVVVGGAELSTGMLEDIQHPHLTVLRHEELGEFDPSGDPATVAVVDASSYVPADALRKLIESPRGSWLGVGSDVAAARLDPQLAPEVLRVPTPLRETRGVLTPAGRMADSDGVIVVRDRLQLARVAARVRESVVASHMQGGVTFLLPDSVLIDVDVRIGPDTVVYPGVVLEGGTNIGAETVIGPGCRIIDSWIGSGVELKGWNYIAHTSVRNRAILEPYVRRGFD